MMNIRTTSPAAAKARPSVNAYHADKVAYISAHITMNANRVDPICQMFLAGAGAWNSAIACRNPSISVLRPDR